MLIRVYQTAEGSSGGETGNDYMYKGADDGVLYMSPSNDPANSLLYTRDGSAIAGSVGDSTTGNSWVIVPAPAAPTAPTGPGSIVYDADSGVYGMIYNGGAYYWKNNQWIYNGPQEAPNNDFLTGVALPGFIYGSAGAIAAGGIFGTGPLAGADTVVNSIPATTGATQVSDPLLDAVNAADASVNDVPAADFVGDVPTESVASPGTTLEDAMAQQDKLLADAGLTDDPFNSIPDFSTSTPPSVSTAVKSAADTLINKIPQTLASAATAGLSKLASGFKNVLPSRASANNTQTGHVASLGSASSGAQTILIVLVIASLLAFFGVAVMKGRG